METESSLQEKALETAGHYPLHLATSYLDGSSACCTIFDAIAHSGLAKVTDVNNLNHTVFDNLMIAILKSHTSMLPGAVDNGLREEKRFPGEEIDICERWDADSECVRALITAGISPIPFEWKHNFAIRQFKPFATPSSRLHYATFLYSIDLADCF